ncbi:nucleotidyltransferase domain-containing protein [Candidatus Woesearchaeota archaeon]|nr:nucleotidyltransferase domain-containing protein [Candidatus Woesearchaeota archaeon]
MEFKIEHKSNPNKDKYQKDDIDIAYDFSKKIVKEFGSFIKSVVLFGSTARQLEKSHDIDILVVVDDVTITISPEVVEAYRVILEKMIRNTSKKLHVTTLKMSNFWDYIRKGDPLGINILRDGVALYDISLFEPLRILLAQGRVAPSKETINIYINKSMGSMLNSKNHILHAVLDLYWGVIDISHAALMTHHITPETPSHVADRLDLVFVKKGKLEARYVKTMKKFYSLSKSIIHNEISLITGTEYDQYYKEAQGYIERLKKLIKK